MGSLERLTFDRSRLHAKPGGRFQTFPRVYDEVDGKDRPPTIVESSAG